VPYLVSLLIPVYNNALYLRELISRTASVLESAGIAFEMVMVDDGSRDESWDILAEAAGQDRRVKAIRLSRNFGQHAAISAALEHASGSRFVLMDADLQDRPELVPELLRKLDEGAHDIVYTVKVGGDDGVFKRLTSLAFHGMVSDVTGSDHVADVGTFRVFNSNVANALRDYRERGVVYGPLMHTIGYDVAYVQVQRDRRIGSRSSYSFAKRMALAFQSIVSYSTLPQRLLLWTGMAVCAASMLYLLAVVIQHLMGKPGLAQGLTLLIVLMLFLIGLIMLSLGILASYLFLIYREILDRPRYHVRRAINLEEPQ
jgi:dolichol-phosphate mannosyltransferase